MKKERNVSLDALRIIAMLMVVMLHLLYKGNALFSIDTDIKNVSWLFEAFSIGAVNIYILISGYFLYDSNFSWKKVIKLWSSVLFYTLLILLIFLILGVTISKKEFLFSVFPVITRTGYWFVTCYILLYILSPFLNCLLKNINKKQHFQLCTILFIVFSCINTFVPVESRLDSTNGYSIIWMIIVYIYATYLKKYYSTVNSKNNFINLFVYIISSFIMFVSYYICQKFDSCFYEKMYWYNSILCVIASISIFMFFKNLKIENKTIIKTISFFASLTFGVYLIHENLLLRQHLYKSLFHIEKYGEYGILTFVIILFGLLILLYVVCSLIEWFRIKLFKIFKSSTLFNKIDNQFVKFFRQVNIYINTKMKLEDQIGTE